MEHCRKVGGMKLKLNKKHETCCPYCTGDVSGLEVSQDDFIDYCKECDIVIEGETVTKLPKGKQNETY